MARKWAAELTPLTRVCLPWLGLVIHERSVCLPLLSHNTGRDAAGVHFGVFSLLFLQTGTRFPVGENIPCCHPGVRGGRSVCVCGREGRGERSKQFIRDTQSLMASSSPQGWGGVGGGAGGGVRGGKRRHNQRPSASGNGGI